MRNKILEAMEDNYDKYSKSFKKILDYIIHHQSVISFISINDLAKKTETSPATVTRFAKKMGFKGYPEFQAIFQKELEIETSHMKGIKNEILENKNSDDIVSDLVNVNIELLREIDTHRIQLAIEQTVKWIKKSRKIYILGARGSYALAHYFYFLLKEFREGVELLISGASDFTDKLLYTTEDDLLFTISFHPYTNFTYQVTEFFKENGNKVVTITDKEDSTLGNISDLVLTTKNGERTYSFVPGVVILNALLIKLGAEDKASVADKMEKLKNITDRFNIYKDK